MTYLEPLLLRLPIDHLRTHDRQIANVPSGLTDDRAVAGNAHRAPDMTGELGLVFGKQPDLALILMPIAFLVEHAHGLGQPQDEGAEPRAVRMLVPQADQPADADGTAGRQDTCAAAGVATSRAKRTTGLIISISTCSGIPAQPAPICRRRGAREGSKAAGVGAAGDR